MIWDIHKKYLFIFVHSGKMTLGRWMLHMRRFGNFCCVLRQYANNVPRAHRNEQLRVCVCVCLLRECIFKLYTHWTKWSTMRRGNLILLVATSISVLAVRALREEICDFTRQNRAGSWFYMQMQYASILRRSRRHNKRVCIGRNSCFCCRVQQYWICTMYKFYVHKQYVLIEIIWYMKMR